LIAASANNVAKGCYALSLGSREAGRQALLMLLALAALGLGLASVLWA
jgi:hypothetical protein